MTVWAIADLHLSFSVPDKKMDIFGEKWVHHEEKIAKHWKEVVSDDDLVLIAGDISWAMRLEEAVIDLEWIDQLPGTKVILKGNHDYWWTSKKKMDQVMPKSIHAIQNNAFHWKGIAIAGTRLWDTIEYSFGSMIQNENVKKEKEEANLEERDLEEQEKIFKRELERLEISLKSINPETKTRIVMTHYPPISADLKPSRVSALLKKYQVSACVFGHVHDMKQNVPIFGEKEGIHYFFTCCDYLNFTPLKILYTETH